MTRSRVIYAAALKNDVRRGRKSAFEISTKLMPGGSQYRPSGTSRAISNRAPPPNSEKTDQIKTSKWDKNQWGGLTDMPSPDTSVSARENDELVDYNLY